MTKLTIEEARERLRAEHGDAAVNSEDVEFTARHGYTPYEAAEASYVAKLMDACDTEEEANAIMDWFAG